MMPINKKKRFLSFVLFFIGMAAMGWFYWKLLIITIILFSAGILFDKSKGK